MIDSNLYRLADWPSLSADTSTSERASTVGTVMVWILGIAIAILVILLVLMGVSWIIEKAPWLVALWITAIPICVAVGYIFQIDFLHGVATFMTVITIGTYYSR